MKSIILAIVFSLCFFIKLPGGFSTQHFIGDNESKIIEVIRGAVEDTRWMNASSRQELDRMLGAYYTGPLLLDSIESAWIFINVPTDWDYVIKAENIRIIEISGDKASACADILERDAVVEVTLMSRAEYHMIKTDNGWKIAAAKYSVPIKV